MQTILLVKKGGRGGGLDSGPVYNFFLNRMEKFNTRKIYKKIKLFCFCLQTIAIVLWSTEQVDRLSVLIYLDAVYLRR